MQPRLKQCWDERYRNLEKVLKTMNNAIFFGVFCNFSRFFKFELRFSQLRIEEMIADCKVQLAGNKITKKSKVIILFAMPPKF